jgi:hypothetical protein
MFEAKNWRLAMVISNKYLKLCLQERIKERRRRGRRETPT